MKKKVIAVMLVAGMLVAGQNDKVTAKTVNVGGKNVVVNSTIARTTASGHTGSDGTIKAYVDSSYYYALDGARKGPYTKTKGPVNSVASVNFSAAAGGVSLSITSHHELSYGGDSTQANTSASY